MKQDSTPTNPATHEDQPNEIGVLREQRELALACFILSATLSVAVLWPNLGAEPKSIGETREAVEVHRKLLQQHRALLVENQKVLGEVEAARDALLRARAGR